MNWALKYIPWSDLVLFDQIADEVFGPKGGSR